MSVLDEELKKYSVDPSLVYAILDGDDRKLDELCLQLLESIEVRRSLEKSGRKHIQARAEAIPDTLIDYLIVFALEACDHHALVVPTSLVILVRERLGGANPARYEKYVVRQKRQIAISLAVAFIEASKPVSFRGVAKEMGIQPSTVKRWFTEKSLGDTAREFMELRKLVREGRK